MILHVDVTPADIALGARCSENDCPVALATQRALNKRLNREIPWIAVGGSNIEFDLDDFKPGDSPDVSVRTPEDVAIRIGIFDEDEVMQPFDFDLDIPNSLIPVMG